MEKKALELLGRADDDLDALNRRLSARLGHGRPLQITPYRGHGTRDTLFLRGRVLAEKETGFEDNNSVWDNVLDMARRFASQERAGVSVLATFQDQVTEAITDDEGYFFFTLEAHDLGSGDEGWHAVDLALAEPDAEGEAVRAMGHALVPPASARFGVISDIDDTILQTHAGDLLQMVRVTLLNDARSRLPFDGVAVFYQALQAGVSGHEGNPIFHLSSSPWNLYDLLVDFMALHDIPAGPLFLQDFGFDPDKTLKLSHEQHKLPRIRELLDLYPELPFLLIGDSGEHDPELYARIVSEYPGRILAVYIRNVSDEARDVQVRALADATAAAGVDLVLVEDSAEAAADAAARGLV